jgi:2-amino-4-hydroxy-6-hydroxymethyldihydropteridine diphosphokinase
VTLVYIGMGSNLSNEQGDSRQIMSDAVHQLANIGRVVKVSGLYSSKPMGPQDQPDYFNAAVALETELPALDLLDRLQQLERDAGRVKLRHWGERTLDLDILLYGQEAIQSTRLTIPHVGLLLRNFVVLPLLDIDSTLQVAGQPLASCAAAQSDDTIQQVSTDWLSF